MDEKLQGKVDLRLSVLDSFNLQDYLILEKENFTFMFVRSTTFGWFFWSTPDDIADIGPEFEYYESFADFMRIRFNGIFTQLYNTQHAAIKHAF